MPRATRSHIFGFVSADVSGKAHEALLLLFLARDANLVGVNHDDEIAGIDMRRKNSLFLSAQKVRCLDRDPTKYLIFGIDQPPFAINFVGFRGKRLHWRLEKGTEATGHEVSCQPAESGRTRALKVFSGNYNTPSNSARHPTHFFTPTQLRQGKRQFRV